MEGRMGGGITGSQTAPAWMAGEGRMRPSGLAADGAKCACTSCEQHGVTDRPCRGVGRDSVGPSTNARRIGGVVFFLHAKDLFFRMD